MEQDCALDDADKGPDRPPQYNESADEEIEKREAGDEVEKSDPESADLKLEVAAPQVVGRGSLDVGNDQTDDGCDDGEEA